MKMIVDHFENVMKMIVDISIIAYHGVNFIKTCFSNFFPRIAKNDPKQIGNGLPFCKNKGQEKSVSVKIAANASRFEYSRG